MILGEATLEVQVVALVAAAVIVAGAGAGGQSPLFGESNSWNNMFHSIFKLTLFDLFYSKSPRARYSRRSPSVSRSVSPHSRSVSPARSDSRYSMFILLFLFMLPMLLFSNGFYMNFSDLLRKFPFVIFQNSYVVSSS